jgi:hypothetical protein
MKNDVKFEKSKEISLLHFSKNTNWYITLEGPENKPSLTCFENYRTIFDLSDENDLTKMNEIIEQYRLEKDIHFIQVIEN